MDSGVDFLQERRLPTNEFFGRGHNEHRSPFLRKKSARAREFNLVKLATQGIFAREENDFQAQALQYPKFGALTVCEVGNARRNAKSTHVESTVEFSRCNLNQEHVNDSGMVSTISSSTDVTAMPEPIVPVIPLQKQESDVCVRATQLGSRDRVENISASTNERFLKKRSWRPVQVVLERVTTGAIQSRMSGLNNACNRHGTDVRAEGDTGREPRVSRVSRRSRRFWADRSESRQLLSSRFGNIIYQARTPGASTPKSLAYGNGWPSRVGIYTCDCDADTAFMSVSNLLEREFYGVVRTRRYREARMAVPVTLASRMALMNIMLMTEACGEFSCRVILRRSVRNTLVIRSSDFEQFCERVYARLQSTYRNVSRPQITI